MTDSINVTENIICEHCDHSYIFKPWDGEEARYCGLLRYGMAKDSDICVSDNDFCGFAIPKKNKKNKK